MKQSHMREILRQDFLSIMKEIRKAGRTGNTGKAQEARAVLRIALLGAGSLQYFSAILGYALHMQGIPNKIYVGTYNGLEFDIMDEQSDYHLFHPQLTVIFMAYQDVCSFPEMFAGEADIQALAQEKAEHYKRLWRQIYEKNGSYILQTNFVIPVERQLGNLEACYIWSRQSFLQRLNHTLMQEKEGFVSILDFDYLASLAGKKKWFDFSGYYLNKCNMSYECLPAAVEEVGLHVLSFCGHVKKCIVLDLDNTLWGGILEESGIEQLGLFPTDPLGEAFRAFQIYLKRLRERGVLLAVCSKNDEDYAKQAFLENPNMVLRLSDISCFVANWENKADNIQKIATSLNIGLDSIVFIDDNPVERDLVRAALPEVEILELSADPADYIMDLENARYFEWLQITKEDEGRAESYRAREEIEKNLNISFDLDEYLESLHMEGSVKPLDSESLARAVQLLNKTNQFNTTGYRSSEAEILKMKEQGYEIFTCNLKDKFTDYGLISVAVLRVQSHVCTVEAWVMSCRVFKRGLEDFMLNHFVDFALDNGADRLTIDYLSTDRNSMLKKMFTDRGFEQMGHASVKNAEKGASHYSMELTESSFFHHKIQEDGQQRNKIRRANNYGAKDSKSVSGSF